MEEINQTHTVVKKSGMYAYSINCFKRVLKNRSNNDISSQFSFAFVDLIVDNSKMRFVSDRV